MTAKAISFVCVLTSINERQITYNYYRSEARLNPRLCFVGRAFAVSIRWRGCMANDYEQPVNRARIVVLAAVALPVFGGLYYALLDYLLFG